MNLDVVYFGVRAPHVGHYFYRADLAAPQHERSVPLPRELLAGGVDARWCYANPVPGRWHQHTASARQTEGVVHLHHAHGWTIAAWWDRSGDKRPGSNAALFVRGEVDYATALKRGREAFPREFARMEAVYCFAPA